MLDKEDGILGLSFRLKREEALRRTRGNSATLSPGMSKSVLQIQNIVKWRRKE
jgi:hypothetical protein